MSAVSGGFRSVGASAYNGVFRTGTEITATPENLRKAIQERGKGVLNCHFLAQGGRLGLYTPLQYAIYIQDEDSVKELLALGAKAYADCTEGTSLHLYMRVLEEKKEPNLEILELLINNLKDPRDLHCIDTCSQHTALETALAHMANYSEMHMGVIEKLLRYGACTINHYGDPPLIALLSKGIDSIHHSTQLNNALKYIECEKKCTGSTFSLTTKEFCSHFFYILQRLKSDIDLFKGCVIESYYDQKKTFTGAQQVEFHAFIDKLKVLHELFVNLATKQDPDACYHGFKDFFNPDEQASILDFLSASEVDDGIKNVLLPVFSKVWQDILGFLYN